MPSSIDEQDRQRNLLFLTDPSRWSTWPYFPLVRPSSEEDEDCGVLCDLERLHNLPGYRCTVFQENLFLMPSTLEELLQLPRESFDNFEELLAAGWRVDGSDPGILLIEVQL